MVLINGSQIIMKDWLSYTSFAYKSLEVDPAQGSQFSIAFELENTGNHVQ